MFLHQISHVHLYSVQFSQTVNNELNMDEDEDEDVLTGLMDALRERERESHSFLTVGKALTLLRLVHDASSSSPSRKDGGAVVVLLKYLGANLSK